MSSATSTVDPPSSNTDADPKTDVERAEVTEAQDAMELLDLVSVDSPYHPIHWSLWKRWWIATVYWCAFCALSLHPNRVCGGDADITPFGVLCEIAKLIAVPYSCL